MTDNKVKCPECKTEWKVGLWYAVKGNSIAKIYPLIKGYQLLVHKGVHLRKIGEFESLEVAKNEAERILKELEG